MVSHYPKPIRKQLFCGFWSKNLAVVQNSTEHAFVCLRAVVRSQTRRIARQIDEMFGVHAGFERVELLVGSYQLAYRSSCIRLRKAEGDFADDFVTFIAPRVRVAALGSESQHDEKKRIDVSSPD